MLNVHRNNSNICPVCYTELLQPEKRYNIDDIFSFWKPIKFSEAVISEHRDISFYTELFICRNCGLEIFLPMVIGKSSFYESVSQEKKDDNKGYYEDSKWEFQKAMKDLSGCRNLIEVGCGPGNFLMMAREKIKDVAGVELNPVAIKKAREKGINVYSAHDDLGHLYGSFDAAVSFHVLEHVRDPIAYLHDLASLLKPNGLIGISVPNQDGPIRFIEPCAMNMPPHHATRWRLRTFEVLANRLGWKIKRVAYEPLLLENHSYYSTYWVRQLLQGSNIPALLSRHCLSIVLKLFFKLIQKTGLKYFRPLKGQTIYVLMSIDQR
jgi:SAM-dependent methyltransferase